MKEQMRKPPRPRGTDSARVIQVIETRSLKGSGDIDDPCRMTIQYWDFEGNLLGELDQGLLNKKIIPESSSRS